MIILNDYLQKLVMACQSVFQNIGAETAIQNKHFMEVLWKYHIGMQIMMI